jgi:hypothetical protein
MISKSSGIPSTLHVLLMQLKLDLDRLQIRIDEADAIINARR